MSGTIIIPEALDRRSRYAALTPQVEALMAGETDPIAAMANLSAALLMAFGWHWVGFYRVIGAELVLGPFQGPVACSRIAFGKGVCGTAWSEGRIQVVPDGDVFPGHIACSALSRSEIVIPLRGKTGQVEAVLDIDSAHLNDFDSADAEQLAALCRRLEILL